MSKLTKYQLRLNNTTWIDVNSRFSQPSQPERLSDAQAVLKASLFNLLNCPIGARGRIFQPEYGTKLLWYLQQPLDDATAEDIQMHLYNVFRRWEPRIEVGLGGIQVIPNFQLPGYLIRVTGTYLENNENVSADFALSQGN